MPLSVSTACGSPWRVTASVKVAHTSALFSEVTARRARSIPGAVVDQVQDRHPGPVGQAGIEPVELPQLVDPLPREPAGRRPGRPAPRVRGE